MADPGPKRRKDARPGEILDAAFAEFAEKGFARATPAGIAKRAGIARATIYLYFDGKDAIFEALLRDRLIAPLEEAADLPLPDMSAEALLLAMFRRFYDDALGGGATALLRILVAEGPRVPQIVRLHHDLVTQSGLSLVRRALAHGVARGEFAPDAEDVDPRVVVAPALMGTLWEMLFAEIAPLDREALLASHVRVVMDGLRPRP